MAPGTPEFRDTPLTLTLQASMDGIHDSRGLGYKFSIHIA